MTAGLLLDGDEMRAVDRAAPIGVELDGDPGSEALRVGGQPLPFQAATLHLAPGSVPVLTVDLPVIGGVVVTLEAHPEVSTRTRRALVAMGWTPASGASVVTCVAGIAEQGTVWLAGDSAGCSGWDLTIRSDPKVFASGPYVLGYAGSYRMGQLLRYSFTAPLPDDGDDLHRFMCTTFMDGLRKILKDGGWAERDKEREGDGGQILAGIAGRLFIIESDYQAGEAADGYAAAGCGFQVARGALFATQGQPPGVRLHTAMLAAERFSNGVRGPFTYADTGAS